VVSSIALLVLSPLFLFVAILIKLTSEGPVFYRSERVGRYGLYFRIYKFRTMVQNAEKIGGTSTPDDDPRITKVGWWLRKYKIDELPQLLNVFKGEMSIVGPRPEVGEYIRLMGHYTRKAILSIRPGITDFASLWNFQEGERLKGKQNPDKYYKEKIRPKKIGLQLRYIGRKSPLTDCKIIAKTILQLFR